MFSMIRTFTIGNSSVRSSIYSLCSLHSWISPYKGTVLCAMHRSRLFFVLYNYTGSYFAFFLFLSKYFKLGPSLIKSSRTSTSTKCSIYICRYWLYLHIYYSCLAWLAHSLQEMHRCGLLFILCAVYTRSRIIKGLFYVHWADESSYLYLYNNMG